MKKKIGIVIVTAVAALMIFAFTGCSNEGFYGKYYGTDVRDSSSVDVKNLDIVLELAEDHAIFGSRDATKKYYVNYSSVRIGINQDESQCYWGTFTHEFKVNEDGTLTLTGYIPTYDAAAENQETLEAVDLVFVKQPA